MSNAFLTALFEHKAWCNRGFIAALRAAPHDVDRRQMAIVLLTLEHTSIVDRIFQAHLIGAKPDFPSVVGSLRPVLDELSETMSRTDGWYMDYVAAVAPEELETVVAFDFVGDDDKGRMSKGQMLAHIITHGASHRGQINKMLQDLHLRGASDMVTTFVGAAPD